MQCLSSTLQLIGAFLLIVGGECLKNCYELPFHVTGRILLGFVHAITTLTVISYASEATTKKIRAMLLGCVALFNVMAIYLATGLAISINNFYQYDIEYDDGLDEQTIDDLEIVSLSGIIIMAVAILALLSAPFITRESIPFMVRNRNDEKAHNEFLALRSSAAESVIAFENWKEHILLHTKNCVNIFKSENSSSLLMLLHTRLLSLFFNSVFLSVMFTRVLVIDEEASTRLLHPYNRTYVQNDMNYAVELLLLTKLMGFICGLLLLLIAFKIKTDRFCFKLAFIWGLCAFIVYVSYSCLHYLMDKPPYRVTGIFVHIIFAVPWIIAFKFDVLQYQQVSEIYQETNNNYKLWSLVFVGCIEQFIQILLLLNIFLFPTLGALMTNFGIFYISLWLLKNRSNDGAIYPMHEVFRKTANAYACNNKK